MTVKSKIIFLNRMGAVDIQGMFVSIYVILPLFCRDIKFSVSSWGKFEVSGK
jgi:hypothetical protein